MSAHLDTVQNELEGAHQALQGEAHIDQELVRCKERHVEIAGLNTESLAAADLAGELPDDARCQGHEEAGLPTDRIVDAGRPKHRWRKVRLTTACPILCVASLHVRRNDVCVGPPRGWGRRVKDMAKLCRDNTKRPAGLQCAGL